MIRRAGWALAGVLAILGILLGARQLTRAVDLAGQVLGDASRTALDTGWLLLLLVATGLVLGLGVSSRRGRAVVRWLQARLTTRPVRWTAAALGVLVLLVLVVVVLPPRFTAHYAFDGTPADELKAQNDVRTTLLQALAGGVLLLGAYFTWRQLRVTREGQITDRYTKAVDQLGSDHLDVRVGGIYALKRIARDSPPDRATIEEVLTAYVRDHAPWPPPPARPSLQAVTHRLVTLAQRQRWPWQRRRAKGSAGQTQPGRADVQAAVPPRPAADVQAAVAVIGRRQLPPDGLRALDLTRADLRGVELLGANLQDARLDGANLQDAQLGVANLQGARLDGANLQDAQLSSANLQYGRLVRANLQRAQLVGANLQRAQLDHANLQDAWLNRANLQDAWLNRANLQEAQMYRTNLQDAQLVGANLQSELLSGANLQGVLADKDTRWPDGFDPQAAGVSFEEHLVERYGG